MHRSETREYNVKKKKKIKKQQQVILEKKRHKKRTGLPERGCKKVLLWQRLHVGSEL